GRRRGRTPPRAAPLPTRRCTRRAPRRRGDRAPRSLPGRARASARAQPRRARPGRTRRHGGAGSAERALQLLEEPLVRLVRVGAGGAVELLEQVALIFGQPPRHLDVDEHALAAAAEALQSGHAAAGEDARGPRLRPRLELELRLAVERRHLHGRAERGVRHRQVDGAEDVVALAHEPGVGLDPYLDVDVAGPAAERARMAFARDADLLAVVDPGRHLDVERPLFEGAPRALAVEARILDDLAEAAARGTGLRAHELAEHAPRHLLQPPAPAAGRTGHRLCPGLRAAAAAGRALD